MDLKELSEDGYAIKNVIHIGAHTGQEVSIYRKLGVKSILLFEPHPDSFSIIEEKYREDSDITLINKALGPNKDDNVTLYCSSCLLDPAADGASSSLLKPKTHLKYYPNITFESEKSVKQITLDEYMKSVENKDDYNFINIDVQGYELEVFKGATETLKHIDHIMTEVSWEELYENCPMVDEIDSFLDKYGFKRRSITKTNFGWGDAFYSKENHKPSFKITFG